MGLRHNAWLALPLALAACNFFGPFSDSSAEDKYRSKVQEGNDAINDGSYLRAQAAYEEAMDIWSRGSEAYLYHAKAILKVYGIDYNYLNDEFTRVRDGGKGIPFVDSNSTTSSVDSIYGPVFVASSDLRHILRNSTDTIWLTDDHRFFMGPDGDTASDGVVAPGVARLDIGLLEAIRGMLAAIDMDGNGHIDSLCGVEVCADTTACANQDLYDSLCPRGRLSEALRLQSYIKLTENLSLDSLNTEDVQAKDVSNNPNEINSFLDAMMGPAAGSNINLGMVDSSVSVNSKKEQEFQKDLSDMATNVGDLTEFLGYMRYNDGTDNDFDGAATTGQMLWHDFDKDGYIRFDYDEDLGSLPRDAGNIGHPLHRQRHPELYLTMKAFLARNAYLAADTGENSRQGQMISHCKDVADRAEISSSLLPALEAICDSISPVLKPTVTPPLSSDWIGGEFGVDEEVLDGADNDMDGLQDEDSRQVIGLDDDNDAVFIGNTPGTVTPMVWTDLDNDGCIDINKGGSEGRAYCVGTLEHRIRLAGTEPDSLEVYYSPVVESDSTDTFDECLADMDRAGLASSASDAVRLLACHFKHIWIAPRPANSEWTGGMVGVDEEILDGIDNDGDGWADEDLNAE